MELPSPFSTPVTFLKNANGHMLSELVTSYRTLTPSPTFAKINVSVAQPAGRTSYARAETITSTPSGSAFYKVISRSYMDAGSAETATVAVVHAGSVGGVLPQSGTAVVLKKREKSSLTPERESVEPGTLVMKVIWNI